MMFLPILILYSLTNVSGWNSARRLTYNENNQLRWDKHYALVSAFLHNGIKATPL